MEAQQLMEIDDKIQSQMGVSDGDEIKARWDEYKQLVRDEIDPHDVSAAEIRELTENNFHSLVRAITGE